MPLYGRKKRSTINAVDKNFNGQDIPLNGVSPIPLRPIEFKNAVAPEENNEIIIKALSYEINTPIPVSRIPSLGVERTIPAPLFIGKPGSPNDEFLYSNPDYDISSGFFDESYDITCANIFLFAHVQGKTNDCSIGIPARVIKEFDVPNGIDGITPQKSTGKYQVTFVDQSDDFSEIKISGINIEMFSNETGIPLLSKKTYEYDNWYNGKFNDYEVDSKVSIGYTNDSIITRNIGERYNWSHGTIWFVYSIGGVGSGSTVDCPPVKCDDNNPNLPNCNEVESCVVCTDGYLCPPVSCSDYETYSCEFELPEYYKINNSQVKNISNITISDYKEVNDGLLNISSNERSIEFNYFLSDDCSFNSSDENCVKCDNKTCVECDDKYPLCQPKTFNQCGLYKFKLVVPYFIDENGGFGLGDILNSNLEEDLYTNEYISFEDVWTLNKQNISDLITDFTSDGSWFTILGQNYCSEKNIIESLEKVSFDHNDPYTPFSSLSDIQDPFKFNICDYSLSIKNYFKSIGKEVTDIDYKCNINRIERDKIFYFNGGVSENNVCNLRVDLEKTANDVSILLDYFLVIARNDVNGDLRLVEARNLKHDKVIEEFVWEGSPEKIKVFIAYNVKEGTPPSFNTNDIIENTDDIKYVDVTDRYLKIQTLANTNNCFDYYGKKCLEPSFNVNCTAGCSNTDQGECFTNNYGEIVELVGVGNFEINTNNRNLLFEDGYYVDYIDGEYKTFDKNDYEVSIVYDNYFNISNGVTAGFNSKLYNNIGVDLSQITTWKLYEILDTSDEYGFKNVSLVSSGVGSNFDFTLSGTEDKKYELVVSYSGVGECNYEGSKIFLINYTEEVETNTTLENECEFLSLPQNMSDEEMSLYNEYREKYEEGFLYDYYKNVVSDKTHLNTDYSSCSYGRNLLMVKENGSSNIEDSQTFFFSNLDGYLGSGGLYELANTNNDIVRGLDVILSEGQHDICAITITKNGRISVSKKQINIQYINPDCEDAWNGEIDVNSLSEKWVEVRYEQLTDQVKLSSLVNIPTSIQTIDCYRHNIDRWSEINGSTNVNVVNGRLDNAFIFNSIKAGRCITFTKGEFDENAIKIHVDFLKDPDNPCCDCTKEVPKCDPDCPPDGWVTTGRLEPDCDCCTQVMFDNGECSKVNCLDKNDCVEIDENGNKVPKPKKSNEWVDKDDRPILQPVEPGCWKQQIKPGKFDDPNIKNDEGGAGAGDPGGGDGGAGAAGGDEQNTGNGGDFINPPFEPTFI